MSELNAAISRLREQITRGDLDAARWPLEKLRKRHPGNFELIELAALFQFRSGNGAKAMEMLREAIREFPDAASLQEALGYALDATGDRAGAMDQLRLALRLDPNRPVALEKLADYCKSTSKWEECESLLRRLTTIAPNYAEGWSKLAWAVATIGSPTDAEAMYVRALSLSPGATDTASNRALFSCYRDDLSRDEVRAIHLKWNDAYAVRKIVIPPTDFSTVDRSPDRPLRIGYVSADFRIHAVNFFFEPVLEHHDKKEFITVCYAEVPAPDAITARLQKSASAWRDTCRMSDADVVAQIRKDRIDILVDLEGHCGGNRLGVFVHRPAPVQITYLGYPNTTAVSAIQYRIGDFVTDPPGMTEAQYTESVVRLPGTFMCYRPDDRAPGLLAQTPAQSTGAITFGSFNNFAKITDRMLSLWAKVLAAVPNSRLLLELRVMDVSNVRERVMGIFAKENVAPERIKLLGWTTPADRFHIVASTDIAFDSFPYTGFTTTYEQTFMGVPTITLAGTSHVSRVSASILTCVGHPELIANSPDEYVAKAIELAGDIPRLSAYRRTLRDHLKASPPLDEAGFTRKLESLYRTLWRKWVSDNADAR